VLVLDAPQNLHVTLASSEEIRLSWTAPSGTVSHYQIERSTNRSGPFTTIATSATTSFYNTGLSGVHSYLYRVRAVDGFGAPSPPSKMALGTSINFEDAQLSAGVTEIKAQHWYDLREAVKAVRALVPGMSAPTWGQRNDLYHQTVLADPESAKGSVGRGLDPIADDLACL
jgi:hypothetical protein